MALFPAMFMSVVVTCYILVAPEGFYGLMTSIMDIKTAEIVGIVTGIVLAVAGFIVFNIKIKKDVNQNINNTTHSI